MCQCSGVGGGGGGGGGSSSSIVVVAAAAAVEVVVVVVVVARPVIGMLRSALFRSSVIHLRQPAPHTVFGERIIPTHRIVVMVASIIMLTIIIVKHYH